MTTRLDTRPLTRPVEEMAQKLAQPETLDPRDLARIARQGQAQAATLARAISFLSATMEIEKSRHAITVYNRKGILKEIKF